MKHPVQTSSGRSLRIEVPCELSAVREATRRLRLFLAAEGLGEAEQCAWELACMEAATNAVEHVRAGCEGDPIRLSVSTDEAVIEVSLTDRTPGFSWPEDPDLPPDDSESGRGIFLITQLTDHVVYLQNPRENRLIMRRGRETAAATPPEEMLRRQVIELDDTLRTMTEELASCYESLTAIFRFTEDLKRGQRGSELAAKWLAELLPVCGADWCVLRLVAADQATLLTAGVAGTEHCPATLRLDEAGTRSAEVRAMLDGADVQFDPQSPLATTDPLHAAGAAAAGVCHPIFYDGQPFGVLSAGRGEHGGLSAGQISILHTFADFLGIQLRNLRLQEEHIRGQLVNRELQIAERIQRSLLPESLPGAAGYTLAGYSESASQVGGDFYDAMQLADGSMLLVMADVMGKGVPAAMFAAILRASLRARTDLAAWPQELMIWLNQNLYADLDRVEMFVTVQLVYFDPQSGLCRVASAGHCPPLVAGRDGTQLHIDEGGPPIGVLENAEYRDEVFSVEPGSTALLFTDGLTDARNAAGETYGEERLAGVLAAAVADGADAGATRRRIAEDIRRFCGEHPAFDDVTFLLLTRAAETAEATAHPQTPDALPDPHR